MDADRSTESQSHEGREVSPLPEAPGIPAVHLPYLVCFAIGGAGGAVLGWIDPGTAVKVGTLGVMILAFALHLVWLYRLFRDGEQVLGSALRLGPVRVVIICALAIYLFPIWTAGVLWLLVTTTERAVRSVDPVRSAEIGRIASDMKGLIVAAGIWGVLTVTVLTIYSQHLALYGADPEAPVPLADVLGQQGAIIIAVFNLVLLVYYLTLVARAVPALYRGYRLLVASRWTPPAPGESAG